MHITDIISRFKDLVLYVRQEMKNIGIQYHNDMIQFTGAGLSEHEYDKRGI